MNQPHPITEEKPKRRHRSPHGLGVYVTDIELAVYLGIPEREAKMILLSLDQNPSSNFPKKQPFWGGRRFLPAVEEWLKEANRPNISVLPQRRRA
jgi:hypothetical protein